MATARPEYAICVRSARKSYSSTMNIVLDRLNMTVPRGSIYGLLGASGCGKSTLLACIMGLRRLDAGDVWVMGRCPGSTIHHGPSIGYMPQEFALYRRFSIREILTYFGWIADMRTEQIEQRIDDLVSELHLPDASSYIEKLSGGQQRRTSLAVALLHDPQLLILDEPTAGVDPILREDLWEHLRRIAGMGNRTIFMTTHYIEEARYANVVGLMRGGKLLAEESPESLMMKYGCTHLVDVFLILSVHQNNDREFAEIPKKDLHYTCNSELSERSSLLKSHRLKAMIWKNWLWMWRSLPMNAFFLCLPCLQLLIFCISVGQNPSDLRLCVVNHELDALSTECNSTLLSCRYLNLLNMKCFKYEIVNSEKEANQELRQGRAWASMVIERSFSESLIASVNMDLPLSPSVEQAHIVVQLDMSNHIIGTLMRRDIQYAYNELSEELLTLVNMNPKLGRLPMKFEKPVYGESLQTSKYTNFMAPGLLLTIIFFISVTHSTGALMHERREGMLERSLVAGVRSTEIFISYFVMQFIIMCGETALLLFGGYVIFDLALTGSIMHVTYLTVLTGCCGICFGFVIATACDNQQTATFVTMGTFNPSIMLYGVIWPLEGMHPALRFLTSYLPLTTAIESLRSITVRGLSIVDGDVSVGFVSLGIWSMMFLGGSVFVMKFKNGFI